LESCLREVELSLNRRVQELYSEIGAILITMKQYFNECHGQPRRYRDTFEQGFAISGFNFNDRLKRETVIYERVVGHMRCATLREHSPLFEFIWHRSSARSDSVLFTIGRSAAAFSDNPMAKPSALYLPFGSAFPGYILRIICLFRSPYTSSSPEPFPACVSPASRRRVSTGMSMQPGTYFWRDNEEKREKRCFYVLLSAASCTCASLSTIPRLHQSASKACGAIRCIHTCT